MIEKTSTKTVQIEKNELNKCNNGERFKVSVITGKRGGNEPPEPRMTVRELANLLLPRLDNLETTVKQQGDLLKRVIELNNLKS
jgi:hypothetical protein